MTEQPNSDRRSTGIARLDAMSEAELAAWGRAQREYQERLYRALGVEPWTFDADEFNRMLDEAS